ncbi:hypothetical protein Hanom_Chr12g01084371 [Helianthus anomalus]
MYALEGFMQNTKYYENTRNRINHIFFNHTKRVNYIVSPCGLHKVTYLGTNSLESHSRVLTFHFVKFEGINVICRLKITIY